MIELVITLKTVVLIIQGILVFNCYGFGKIINFSSHRQIILKHCLLKCRWTFCPSRLWCHSFTWYVLYVCIDLVDELYLILERQMTKFKNFQHNCWVLRNFLSFYWAQFDLLGFVLAISYKKSQDATDGRCGANFPELLMV